MTRQAVKVGVIGVGALGRHHARLYAASPQAELVGVYDADPDAAKQAADDFATDVFPASADLADVVDCISVAVPTDLHFQVVADLLDRGRHVLVEKPLAATVEEGQALVDKARSQGLALQVGHVEQYNPVISYLEDKIEDPRFIESHRLASYPPPRPGQLPRGTEVGVVLDLMIHDLDVILNLVKSPVEAVDAVGVPVLSPSLDIANARITFASGCVANVTASRVSPERVRKIRVFQPAAYLSLDYEAKKGESFTHAAGAIKREAVPIADRNALQDELEDFLRCAAEAIATGVVPEPGVSGERAQRALELAAGITQQITEKNARFTAK